jgi:hypothetical protein
MANYRATDREKPDGGLRFFSEQKRTRKKKRPGITGSPILLLSVNHQ